VQFKPSGKPPNVPSTKTAARVLQVKPSWGDVTGSDEVVLYENPEMVPVQMRKHVRSLVWLAQKDAEYVKQVLAKYDARSLAEAWIGPDEVLKSLETGLPEKKLRLLQTYRAKLALSRDSDIFQVLVDEGLKDEVA
jgi:hypothetical protein